MRKRGGALSSRLKVAEAPDEVRVRAWAQLLRASLVFQRRVSNLIAEHDMTMAQFDVMASLKYEEGVTQQELAARLLVTKGNICGLIGRLEGAGWVERCADAADARANRVYLTATGRRKIESALPVHDEFVAGLLTSLSISEVTELRHLLRKVEEGVQQ